jgi:predicted negative regulator of RcsB-dependent stress response
MAQPTRRQVEQDLNTPDPFFEAVAEARDYFEENRTQVLAVVLGVATVLFSVVAGTSWYISQGNKAATDFASAVSNLEFDSPSAAEASLKNLSGRTNAGPYKSLAALYRGDLAADAGRFDEAIAEYDSFLADAPTDYLKQIGLMGKAAALEKAGKAPEAGAALDQAATIDGPYRTAALSDRARLAEKAGDKATATTNLQKLLEIEGSGPGSAGIEQRLQALK